MANEIIHPVVSRSNNFEENIYIGFDAVVDIFMNIITKPVGSNPKALDEAFDIKDLYNASVDDPDLYNRIELLNTIVNRNLGTDTVSVEIEFNARTNEIIINYRAEDTSNSKKFSLYEEKNGLVSIL